MPLSGLLAPAAEDPATAAAVAAARDGARPTLDVSAPPGARPFTLAAVAAAAPGPLLAVTATGREADDLAAALRSLLGAACGGRVPGLGDAAARAALAARRHGRAAGSPSCAGWPIRRDATRPPGRSRSSSRPCASVLQPQVRRARRPGAGAGHLGRRGRAGRACCAGWTARRTCARTWSRSAASSRCAAASSTSSRRPRSTRCGSSSGATRSRRSATSRWPTSARSRSPPHGLWAPPCRELLLTDDGPARARASCALEYPELAEMLDQIAEGIAGRGHGVARARPRRRAGACCIDLLPADTHVVVLRPGAGPHPGGRPGRAPRASSWTPRGPRRSAAERRSTWAPATSAARRVRMRRTAPGGRHAFDSTRSAPRHRAVRRSSVERRSTPSPTRRARRRRERRATCVDAPRPSYRGDTAADVGDARSWLARGLAGRCWSPTGTARPSAPPSVLAGRGRGAGCVDRARARRARRRARHHRLASSAASIAPTLQLAVLTESDLAGQRLAASQGQRRMPSRRRNAVDPLQLKAGRLRRARAARRRPLRRDGAAHRRRAATREYLVIEYAPTKRGQPGDRLYVPTDQLDQVTQYVGGEAPVAARGSAARTGPKAKGTGAQGGQEIAAELIQLYSARMATPGHAFGPDTPWQRELEDAFPLRRDARPAGRDRRGQGATWRSRSRWTA